MSIDIVIPNYNGSDLLEKSLPILLARTSSYKIGKIIITDDFSKAEDYEKLKKIVENLNRDKKIILVRNERNLGFASNVNIGAAQGASELIVFLNTDVIVEENFLDAALDDFKDNKNLFGVGFMDKSIEEGEVVLRGRGVAYWSRGFVHHARGEVDKSDTFWISGGSSIVRRDIFEKLSGFDEIYNPFYWEDIDLSYRAQRAGYEILFENKSVVEHYHNKGSIKKHYKSENVKTIAYRNQFIFIWKNIKDLSLILNHIVWLPYHIARAIVCLDKPFIFGFVSAVLKIHQVVKKRIYQSRYSKLTDRDVLY